MGTGYTKLGLALEDYECVVVPSVMGRGKGDDKDSLSFGENALRRLEKLEVIRPILKKGKRDWA